jgi:MFS family permease
VERGSWLNAFSMRNYRLFIAGLVISNAGTWMQRVAQSWLILRITDGAGSALGITTGLQFLPILLFGAWGGVIVDRHSRRGLILITQAGMGLLALALGVLTITDTVRVWHVYVLAFLLGTLNAFDNPGRNSLLSEIVGPERLGSAVSLNSACFNLARMVGPSLGGLLVAAAGTATAFLVNAASYLVVVLTLWALRRSEMYPAPLATRRSGQIREGLRYVGSRPDLMMAMIVIGFVNTFSLNFQITIALMAREALGLPASGYGVLFGAVGAGSIVGALLSARRARPRMRIMLAATFVVGALEILGAVANGFFVLFGLLLATGGVAMTVSTSSNTMVQLGADPALRGRTMALYFLASSAGRPFGAPLLGAIGGWFGPRWSMASSGFASVAVAVASVAFLLWRGRRLRVKTDAGEPRSGARVRRRRAV